MARDSYLLNVKKARLRKRIDVFCRPCPMKVRGRTGCQELSRCGGPNRVPKFMSMRNLRMSPYLEKGSLKMQLVKKSPDGIG